MQFPEPTPEQSSIISKCSSLNSLLWEGYANYLFATCYGGSVADCEMIYQFLKSAPGKKKLKLYKVRLLGESGYHHCGDNLRLSVKKMEFIRSLDDNYFSNYGHFFLNEFFFSSYKKTKYLVETADTFIDEGICLAVDVMVQLSVTRGKMKLIKMMDSNWHNIVGKIFSNLFFYGTFNEAELVYGFYCHLQGIEVEDIEWD